MSAYAPIMTGTEGPALVEPTDRFAVTGGYARPSPVIPTLLAVLTALAVLLSPLTGNTLLTRAAAPLVTALAFVLPTAVQVLGFRLLGGRGVQTGWLASPRRRGATGHVFLVSAWMVPWAVQTFTGDARRDRRPRAALALPFVLLVAFGVLGGSLPGKGDADGGASSADLWWVLSVFTGILGIVLLLVPSTRSYAFYPAAHSVPVPPVPETIRQLDEIVTARLPYGRPVGSFSAAVLDRWGQQLPTAMARQTVDVHLVAATKTQRRRAGVHGAVALLGIGPELLRDTLVGGTGDSGVARMQRGLLALVDDDPTLALQVLAGLEAPLSVHLVRTAAFLAMGDLTAARSALGPPPSRLALRTDPYLALARACGAERAWGDALMESVTAGAVDARDAVIAMAQLDPDRLVDVVGDDIVLLNNAVSGLCAARDLERLRSVTSWIDRVAADDNPAVRDSAGFARVLLGDPTGRALMTVSPDPFEAACYARLADGVPFALDSTQMLTAPLQPTVRRLLVQAVRAG